MLNRSSPVQRTRKGRGWERRGRIMMTVYAMRCVTNIANDDPSRMDFDENTHPEAYLDRHSDVTIVLFL